MTHLGLGLGLGLGNAGLATPKSIMGPLLELWLREDTGVTLTSGKISTFADTLSGKGYTFVQGNATLRPIHDTNGPDGHGSIYFGPTDTWFQTAHDFSALTAGECFYIGRRTSEVAVNGNNCIWDFGSSGSASVVPFLDGVIYDDWGSTTRQTTGNPSADLSQYHLYNVISTGSEWTSLINGTQHYTTATNTPGFLAGCVLGGDGSGISFLDGNMVEYVMLNGKCSTLQRTQMKSYFRRLYPSITIA